jgi:hypothetical protein
MGTQSSGLAAIAAAALPATARVELIVLLPSPDELAAHDAYLATLDRESRGACVWLRLEAAA